MEPDNFLTPFAVVVLAWLLPTGLMAGQSNRDTFTARLGNPIAVRVTSRRGWRYSALAKAITARLDAAGQAEYTAGDYVATEIGVALVAGAMGLAIAYAIGFKLIPVWSVGAIFASVFLRWWRLGRRAKLRQLQCRLEAPRFVDEFRIKVKSTAGRTVDLLREVAATAPERPFYAEVAKAVKIADTDAYITLAQALDARAIAIASPKIRSFFNVLEVASRSGGGRIEACTRFSVQMRQEIQYQAKRRIGRLVFISIVSLVFLGLPSALILMSEVPLISTMQALRSLGG